MTVESRWCPSCGDEFERWVAECDECEIDLVDAKPEVLVPVAPRASAPVTDVLSADEMAVPPMRVELEALADEDRAELLEHLNAVPIPHVIAADGAIEAVTGYEDEFDQALQRVRGGHSPHRLRSVAPLADGRPLSIGRRGVGAAVDAAIGVGAAFGAVALDLGGVGALAVLFVLFANQVVGVTACACSIGKLAVGGRVRSMRNRELSWSEATVRWLVRDGLAVAAVATFIGIDDPGRVWIMVELFGLCWVVALAASIFIDLQRRGLHDLAVDSVVVSAATISNWPADGAKSGT